MKNNKIMKKIVLLVSFALLYSVAFSQTYLMNASTNGTTINTCSGTLYDSGGANGNYSNNENYYLTICSSIPGGHVQLTFTQFQLESSTFDWMTIYDGPNQFSPVLVNQQGSTSLLNQTVTATGSCLTIWFRTDGSVTYAGFAATISCNFPCQNFTVDLISPTLPVLPDTAVYTCPNTGAQFIVQGNYPNSGQNYPQSDATTTFTWYVTTVQQTTYSGQGMTTLPYNFNTPGGTYITFTATDINGCEYIYPDDILVYVSVPPTFVGTSADQTIICPGEEVNFEGFVQVEEWVVQIPDIINECFCADDDHYQQPQCAEFVQTAFAPGQVITSVNDIESICMMLEHSYIGDLDMWITCPNGQTMYFITYPNNCGLTYFGQPVDNDNLPCTNQANWGVLYHYCWTPTATQTIPQACPSYSTMPSGNYAPVQPWTNLIGCPVNGTWQVCFRDNLYSDDGVVCDFELHFSPNILPSPGNMWSFQNTYDPNLFVWSGDGVNPNSGGTATAYPTTSGDQIFTFSATDDFGCTYDTTLVVHVRAQDDPVCCAQPDAFAGPDDHVCTNTYNFHATLQQGNTGQWSLVSGPGTVSWQNQNSPNATVTVSQWGVYEFEWREINGPPTCFDTDSVIVEFYPVPTTTFTYTPILCYGNTTNITYTGNVGPTATYNWNFGNGTVHSGSGQGPYVISWTDVGNNTVTLQVSANGCDSPDTLVNIYNPPALTHTLILEDDPCFNSCRGRAQIHVTGGTLPYTYSWASPTNILPNLCAGNYQITVTDNNGCTTGQNFAINQPPELLITNEVTQNLSCYQSNDGFIEITTSGGTGNHTFIWFDSPVSSNVRTGLSAGTYFLTITDENDCQITQQYTITQPDQLVTTISPNTAICEGQTTVISSNAVGGTEPYRYFWDDGTGVFQAGPSLTLAPSETTTFTLYVLDANDCLSNTVSMTVTVSPLMVIDHVNIQNNRCYNSCDGRAEVLMTGGIPPFNYSWGSPTNVYDGLCAGIYTLTITDIIGCNVNTSFVITQPTPLTYTTESEPATCYGYTDGVATIYVQGSVPPYTYLWPNGHNTNTLTTGAGTYTVTVTDYNECRVTAQITINQPTPIYVTPIPNRTICQGQTTTLSAQATGGTPYAGGVYDFRWTGSDGSIYNSNIYEASPTHTTTYNLVVTDSHGCTGSPAPVTVIVNPPLDILSVVTSNDTICPGDPAIIYVDAIGGNGGPYIMTLQDGRVVATPFTVTPEETTMFVITLADMCGTPPVKDSILINVRPKPGNIFVADKVEGCPPLTIQFNENSPDRGQTYLWEFGDNGFATVKNPLYTYTKEGAYSVSLEVTDNFGCKHKRTVENMIMVYTPPKANFVADPEVVSMLSGEVKFINHSTNAVRYFWFFGDGDSSMFAEPRHVFKNIGEYDVMLIAESSRYCHDTVTKKVIVENQFAFYIPTSFTPNGDGVNDCFRPCGNGISKQDFKFVVYDRWGNPVFSTEKYDPSAPCDACTDGAWDGTRGNRMKGDPILPNGTYHWYCEFKDWNGTIYQKHGTVQLIR